jgi:hypothetical protein
MQHKNIVNRLHSITSHETIPFILHYTDKMKNVFWEVIHEEAIYTTNNILMLFLQNKYGLQLLAS